MHSPFCQFAKLVCRVEKVDPAVTGMVVLGDLQPGYQLVLHWLVIGTILVCCCDLEVSSLNSCTPVLLFSFTFNNVIENKVVEGALISLINLIQKIWSILPLCVEYYEVSFKLDRLLYLGK